MPSIWIILAAAVGAINMRLLIPGIGAYFGVGRYAPPRQRGRRLTL